MFPNIYHSLIHALFGGQAPTLSVTPPAPMQGQVNAPGPSMTTMPHMAPQVNAPGPSMTTTPQMAPPMSQGFVNAPGQSFTQQPSYPYYHPTVQSLLRNI